MSNYEKRLDGVIHLGEFKTDDDVEVRTKMGDVVTNGKVCSKNSSGLIIKESSGGTRFCSGRMYLFARKTVTESMDTHLDERVRQKLQSLNEAGDTVPDNTGAKKMGDDDDEKEKKDKSKDIDPKEKDQKEKDDDEEETIDVDQLPGDIKASIITTDKMDESQLNSVLSDISDAALKALKRAKVSESELFGVVQKISDAANKILSGKKQK